MIQSDFDQQIAQEFAQNLADKGPSFMGVTVFDPNMLLMLMIRFAANLLICWIIIQFFYYRKSKRKDYYFTFMLFSVTIFLLLFILQNLSMEFGFALGLFCIFGMIRYRTETVQIREMTYLFVIIGISAVNGLSMDVDYTTLLAANLLFLIIIWVMESNKFVKHTSTKIVLYEKIALIKPDRYNDMLEDLRDRTGLDIQKVEVGHIDFLRDVAFLKVYYKADSDQINTIDNVTRFS
ncbi:DUF4956 domain-containing protein [Bacteroidales bacterium OttesenSCG-928-J19]|nr:DUF4956 domain-containing protein [Bacteroidales bacterium OttesenSCG-928-J19]